MNTLDALNHYLRRIERTLGWFAFSRGAAVVAGAALLATVILAMWIGRGMLSPSSLLLARFALFLCVGIALAFGLVLPLARLNRRNAARRAERTFPQFEQRLLTIAERGRDGEDPFLALLASEAGEVAQKSAPSRVAPRGGIAAFLASAAGAAAVLVWLVLAGPGTLGNGAALLWAGPSKAGPEGMYSIGVKPGNAAVRRKSDQWITADLRGFEAPEVRLFARFRGGSKWEEAPMLPRSGGAGYEFLFAALPEDVEYYVQSRGVRSQTYKLSVLDLPSVRKFKVTYRFPSWTGMSPAVEDPGGDLRAVAGTVAELAVEFDRPAGSTAVMLDDGTQIKLEGEGAQRTVQIPIQKDGMFHFAGLEGEQVARLSDDYFIEARNDSEPSVRIVRPGRDARVSPIEEVPVVVEAEDDFGLRGLTLHYSVNGGEERTVSLLPRSGVKQANGKTLIALEDFKMSPGDVVGMYATASDARNATQTDMFFLEAQPYERDYSQSQEAGGGGGGGDGGAGDEQRIAARQKEIIAATWNQIKDRNRAKNPAEDARFLSEVQRKLRDQAQSMVQRAKSRQLAGTNDTFQLFVRELEAASKEMAAAADKLKAQSLREALPSEQRALQHLLRAEMSIKDIQVAFGSRGGGGGGGGAARDLENLFDLELDTEKNQYETGQQMASGNQRQKEIDEALQRLEQLARRQQELADQQRQGKQQQAWEQRWQQEQLRREAEELRRQMEQLTKSGSQSQSGQQGQSGQQSQSGSASSQSASSQSGSSGSQSSQSERQLRQAFDRLSRATDDMREAASRPEQREAGARRAAERLQEAQGMLRGMRREQSSSQLSSLGERAGQLTDRQRQFSEKLRQATGGGSPDARSNPFAAGQNREQNQRLAGEKEQMMRELERLESDVQRAARELQGSQPGAAGKLRQGLSEVQQNEIRLRMKYAANWIRNGRGQFLSSGEAITTASLERLRDGIREAQRSVERAGGEDKGKSGDKTEQALERVEQAREALERAARAAREGREGRGQPGQQGGREEDAQQQSQQGGEAGRGGQQQSQNGQQSGQQGGQQGGQQSGQQSGQRGGQQQAQGQGSGGMQPGGSAGRMGSPGRAFGQSGGGLNTEAEIRQAMRDLQQLRQQFGPGTEVGRDLAGAIRELDRMQQFPLAGPEMEARLAREVLPSLEQLELQLRRKLDEGKGGARNPSMDRVPPGYADRVAEYFRRLSKSQ